MKKFKAEAFDLMQYFYGAVHDPLVHCLVKFKGHIDETTLKKAVTLSLDAIPLIRCCFDAAARRPCWKDQGFTGNDIVHIIKNETNTEDQIQRLFASKIDMTGEPQLKIYIIREQDSDTLLFIINHMVCDGSGFKEYLYLLSDLYTKCKNNIVSTIEVKPASRCTRQLFHGLSLIEKLGVLFSKYDLSKLKDQLKYPLQGDEKNPLFVTLLIDGQELARIKAYAKEQGVTVNDLILAAYTRVLYRRTGNEHIVIPCPVDLRKYMRNDQKPGICNLTSNFICDVHVKENDSFKDTLAQVSSQMKQQKSSRNCLKSVIMLELAFHLISFRRMKKVFYKVFSIPVTSFTNLGIIDKKLLKFNDTVITYAYMTGAVKYVPYFQIAVSTYDGSCVLSSNLFGTPEDETKLKDFLADVKEELSFHN